ncbi:MAG: LemA family protein [Clostridia bacterium]|nr:LemA family protein [Clostridia bacterium]
MAVAVVVVLALIIWAISTYNKIVSLRVQSDDGFSTIDVYLKKRYDLIPNLVETVKGYAKHESETLEKVIAARNQLASASTTDEKVAADGAMTQAVRELNMVVERYPELKANTNFLDLQGQLKSVESELAQARKYYNATVRVYNVKIQSFPSLIIAKLMKAKAKAMFNLDDAPAERQNVKVSF